VKLSGIMARYQRYGWSPAVGEWGAIQANHRADLHAVLQAGDVNGLRDLLKQMFRGPLAHGLVSMPASPEAFPSHVNWRMGLWAMASRARDARVLAATEVGNPPVVYVGNGAGDPVPVMPDTPRYDVYARRIAEHGPRCVLELGCGYGGAALQMFRHGIPRVVLCDLPETLYLAGYWLAGHGYRVAWADEADAEADVILLPLAEQEAFTGFDLVFSAHSLSGIPREASAAHLDWLTRSGARWFYHDDAVERVGGVWMTDTFPEVLADAIVPQGFRELWRTRTPWGGLSDRFEERFYERAA
jgi:hypothetical protein